MLIAASQWYQTDFPFDHHYHHYHQHQILFLPPAPPSPLKLYKDKAAWFHSIPQQSMGHLFVWYFHLASLSGPVINCHPFQVISPM